MKELIPKEMLEGIIKNQEAHARARAEAEASWSRWETRVSQEENYLRALEQVLAQGEEKESRAVLSDGSRPNTRSLFGITKRYSLDRFALPLITTKKMGLKGFVVELLWFLRGDTNIKFLVDNGVTIWNEWATAEGELGPVYGSQWRNWYGVDQIKQLEKELHENPFSRRHILSAWNVSRISEMKLPPCHIMAQFDVNARGELSCQMYQRSADMFLGVPWNIACYSLLTLMLAHTHGFTPKEFIHVIGDAHIYENHIDAVQIQLKRIPSPAPHVRFLRRHDSILDYKLEDIVIEGYECHPALQGEVAV